MRTPVRAGIAIMLGVILGLAALLGCGSENGGATDAPSTTARVAAAGIDEASIRPHLSRLTGESAAPLESGAVTIAERGSVKGRRAAAEYMEQSLEKIGLPARIVEFSWGEVPGFNVEATLEGTGGEKHLWVTAHMDSVHNAGANDNASGLVSILMTARALKRLEPKHTVHFVAYDLEEVNLVGSSRYVGSTVSTIRKQEGERAIIGNLNSDMVGYQTGGFDAVMGTCDRAGTIDDALLRASKILHSPVDLREVCLGRSDHEHFWDLGLPALVLTDGAIYDGYPCYHKPCDTLDKLDLSYLRSMIRLTAAAAALLADSKS